MADIDGTWNCAVESPLGRQEFVLVIASAGPGFTGSVGSGADRREIDDGTVTGDSASWTMALTKPLPISLICTATATGDSLEGKVTAGIFGSFPLTGTRAG